MLNVTCVGNAPLRLLMGWGSVHVKVALLSVRVIMLLFVLQSSWSSPRYMVMCALSKESRVMLCDVHASLSLFVVMSLPLP